MRTTVDYFARYGLEFDPFVKVNGKAHDHTILLETAEVVEIKARLGTLAQIQGFGVLTGEAGCGKTTSAKAWADSLNPSRFKVCEVALPSSLTVTDFYREIAFRLGVQPRFRKSDLFEDIQQEIRRYAQEKRITPVIIIDEADKLPSRVFLDLQAIFNFDMDSRDLAVILLVGLPPLNITLNQNAHEPLRQRIVMNYHMAGISKDDGRKYIAAKLDGAGCRQNVFDANAVEAIVNAANGTPRMINKICNRSLILGASLGLNVIDAGTVGRAVNDCQLG